MIAGRAPLDRLAWAAVVFGVWDIAYYGWLWVLSGWPTGPGTWDLLFRIPLPWAGPVWAPVAASTALIGFGLAMAWRASAGALPATRGRELAALLLAGAVVIASFMTNAAAVLAGDVPDDFAWPLFAAWMTLGVIAALSVLRAPRHATG